MGLTSVALAPILAGVLFFGAPSQPPVVVVDTLGNLVEVGTGTGWGIHPDTQGTGAVRLVEGPAAPPLGRGSLLLATPASTDRALAFAVPTGGTTGPGGVFPTPVPWTGLSASYATFIPEGLAANSTPTLRIVGYHDLLATDGPTGFTTLTFQPQYNGPVENGVWQTWEIGPESIMFQSNTSDAGFCNDPATCTLQAFMDRYPDGGWGEIQVGVGSGVPAGSLGYADAVVVRGNVGGTPQEYAYDFEIPASEASTATITPGPATSTGGSATVTLDASALSVTDPVPFTIAVTLPDGTVETQVVEVPAGTTVDVPIPVPFGVTHIEVSAQGTVIAEGDVTFLAPVTPPVTPPVTELPPTGFDPIATAWGSALLAAGVALVAVARVRSRRALLRSEDRIG